MSPKVWQNVRNGAGGGRPEALPYPQQPWSNVSFAIRCKTSPLLHPVCVTGCKRLISEGSGEVMMSNVGVTAFDGCSVLSLDVFSVRSLPPPRRWLFASVVVAGFAPTCQLSKEPVCYSTEERSFTQYPRDTAGRTTDTTQLSEVIRMDLCVLAREERCNRVAKKAYQCVWRWHQSDAIRKDRAVTLHLYQHPWTATRPCQTRSGVLVAAEASQVRNIAWCHGPERWCQPFLSRGTWQTMRGKRPITG